MSSDLIARYDAVISELNTLNIRHHATTCLLAVSKTHPAKDIRALYTHGQRDFGENYLQEALKKMDELGDLPLIWHYIGHIQRNKTRDIAMYFDWVQTLERAIIAERLNTHRPEHLAPLNVLIQINIDDESGKSGCQPDDLDELVACVMKLPRLSLRGLMIIPAKDSTDAFARTKQIFDAIKSQYNLPYFDTLSMGMSSDVADAMMHGSTMVRVGTAIFGERVRK